jgi:hypothetical protein
MSDLDALGRAAYDVAHEHLGITASTPAWDEAHERVREAWRAAADAVRTYEHPTHARGLTTVTQPVRLEVAGFSGRARRIEPPFASQPGDRIGLGERVFRVWRGGDLVADYAAGDDGVLRPVLRPVTS